MTLEAHEHPKAQRPWRCFWAVLLPESLRHELAAFVRTLRLPSGTDEDWRFTDPEGWHVTLAFLGATPAESVEPMVRRVAVATSGLSPFVVQAGGLGGFPRGRRARVLWYGVDDHDGQLRRLAEATRQAAELPQEQAFRAHVTLARARDRRGALLPTAAEAPPAASVSVDAVALFRSHLGGGPARYEVLSQVPLGAPAAVESVP